MRPRRRQIPFRLIVSLLLVVLFCHQAHSQSWIYQKSNTTEDIRRASFADSLNGISVTFPLNLSFQTSDGGKTWNQQLSRGLVWDVSMLDANTAFEVNENGEVYRSTNSGFSWQYLSKIVHNFSTITIYGLSFYNDKHGIGVGIESPNGTVRTAATTDGGLTWSLQQLAQSAALEDVAYFDSLTAVAASGQGVWRTTNGGASWNGVLPANSRAVSFLNKTDGVVGGQISGNWGIFRTTDGGATWSQEADTGMEIESVAMIDTNGEVAVGWNGYGGFIKMTTDRGAHWTVQSCPYDLHHVSFPDAHHGYIFGAQGTILTYSPTAGYPWPNDVTIFPPDNYPTASVNIPGLSPYSVRLAWNCDVNISLTHSRIQFSTDPSFSAGGILVDSLVPIGGSTFLNTSLIVGNLSKRTTYYWRLAWQNVNNLQSAWSDTWSFTTSGASLGGQIYNDVNRNGVQDTLEPAMPNAQLQLSGKLSGVLQADITGRFFLDGIDSGSYTITSLMEYPWRISQPDTNLVVVHVNANDSLSGNDFGWYYPWNSVNGTVFIDQNENGFLDAGESGSAGWMVRIHESSYNDSMLVDGSGYYHFDHVPLGYIQVWVDVPPGWEQIYPQYQFGYNLPMLHYDTHYGSANFAMHSIPDRSRVSMLAIEANGIFSAHLGFGVRGGATDGIWRVDTASTIIDYSEGEVELPPIQSGSFDVRFKHPPNGRGKFGNGAWVDMRAMVSPAQVDTYLVAFLPGDYYGGAYPMTFTWSKDVVGDAYDGPVSIIVAGQPAPIDMKLANSLTVSDPGIKSFLIVAQRPHLTFLYDEGWNLLSLDVTPWSDQQSDLFPYSNGPAFSYAPGVGYTAAESIVPGAGYWLSFQLAASEVGFTGQLHTSAVVDVVEGWNLIGTISTPVAVSSIETNPPGIQAGNFFGYKHSSYVVADTLRPKYAYWVKMHQAGQLTLSSGSTVPSSSRIRIVPVPGELPPAPPLVDGVIGNRPPALPKQFALGQNYPNPFNPTTKVSFSILDRSFVSLKVYNVLGREVGAIVGEELAPGEYTRMWDASNMPSGVYFYRLVAGRFTQVRKMLLVR